MNRAHSFSRSGEFTDADIAVDPGPSTDQALASSAFSRSIGAGDLLQLGFIAPLCLAADTVEQALSSAARFSPLWSSWHFRYEPCGLDAVVRGARSERRDESSDADAINAVMLWIRLATRVAARRVAPLSIGAPPQCTPALARMVGGSLASADDAIAVSFHECDVRVANPAADARLFRVLHEHAEQRMLDLERVELTSARVRRALDELRGRAELSAERLGRELGLGVRTLHRRLRAEGTTFRRLLMEFQLERSLRELESSSATAKQVAFALGFADPASFHRAFKRWTGQTISEYRRAAPHARRGRDGASR